MSIPHLNTLGSGRRGVRLRARRGQGDAAQYGHVPQEEDVEKSRDTIIQHTDHDASSSRMSAISLGYLDDPYAAVLFATGKEVPKRYPIINRGSYVRTAAIDRLVTRFLESEADGRKQIVSLGAGSDTRFFRLCAGKHKVKYHELDFEANVNPKRTAIRASEQLSRMTAADESGSSYHLHALDLRDLTNKSPPIVPELESDIPTLIISECCLCYLPPDTTSSVIQYFTMHIKSALGMIIYEPVRPFDAFGKTMVANLGSRGIELRTLKRFYSLDAQRQRLRLSGFTAGQGARDTFQLWNSDEWTSMGERERIDKLEWLDEIEEWKLLARHYCVAWAWNGEPFNSVWKDVKGDRTEDELKDEDIAR